MISPMAYKPPMIDMVSNSQATRSRISTPVQDLNENVAWVLFVLDTLSDDVDNVLTGFYTFNVDDLLNGVYHFVKLLF